MRGNHLYWGRQDYVEPAPMSASDRKRVASVTVTQVPGKKTWLAAYRAGELLGYVSTRLGGQWFRAINDDDWTFAASDWNQSDPAHGQAILALLAYLSDDGVTP